MVPVAGMANYMRRANLIHMTTRDMSLDLLVNCVEMYRAYNNYFTWGTPSLAPEIIEIGDAVESLLITDILWKSNFFCMSKLPTVVNKIGDEQIGHGERWLTDIRRWVLKNPNYNPNMAISAENQKHIINPVLLDEFMWTELQACLMIGMFQEYFSWSKTRPSECFRNPILNVMRSAGFRLDDEGDILDVITLNRVENRDEYYANALSPRGHWWHERWYRRTY